MNKENKELAYKSTLSCTSCSNKLTSATQWNLLSNAGLQRGVAGRVQLEFANSLAIFMDLR